MSSQARMRKEATRRRGKENAKRWKEARMKTRRRRVTIGLRRGSVPSHSKAAKGFTVRDSAPVGEDAKRGASPTLLTSSVESIR